jgi:hypothetical protein
MAQATTDFFGAEALEDPADDALGYAPFAAKLADAQSRDRWEIKTFSPDEELVFLLFSVRQLRPDSHGRGIPLNEGHRSSGSFDRG